jgi:hypothetical protein
MRRFRVYRPDPHEGYRESGAANAPEEVQFEGVVFSDGTVCVRWLTAYRSHSIWDSWESLKAIHGHEEYGTRIEWLDEREKYSYPKYDFKFIADNVIHGSCNSPDCRYCNFQPVKISPYTTGDD